MERKLATIPGIADDHIDLQVDTPQVEVKVDLAKVARYGLKPGDVRRAASTLMAGEDVGSVIRDGKTYGVMVWSTPATRQSVASISDLLIDTPSGTPVRVGDVAKVSVQPVPNIILRDDGSRRIDVVATVRGSDLGSVVGDVNKVLAKFSTPSGYRVELLGEFKERQAAQGRLLGVAIVAGLVIFLLLQTSFGSWRMATLVFLTLPMALAGGVIAAWAGGGVISIGSLLGFFTVFGIAARNGILLINHCQHLERVEGEASQACTGAARSTQATRADPDGLIGNRAGSCAIGGSRRPPRPRDRVPAGRRHSRRPGHLDPAQPVRRTVALPSLWREPAAVVSCASRQMASTTCVAIFRTQVIAAGVAAFVVVAGSACASAGGGSKPAAGSTPAGDTGGSGAAPSSRTSIPGSTTRSAPGPDEAECRRDGERCWPVGATRNCRRPGRKGYRPSDACS